MDLDNFKDINDSHGHHVGDRALRELPPLLRSAIRPYDICVRYAGDEFIVVLSGCGQEEAERKRIELQRDVDRCRVRSAAGPAHSAGRSASAPRFIRTTATPMRRCSPRPTAACIATRRAASSTPRAQGLATGTDGREPRGVAAAPVIEPTDSRYPAGGAACCSAHRPQYEGARLERYRHLPSTATIAPCASSTTQ